MTKVEISEELLDAMVNAITQLPYRDAQPIFVMLSEEMTKVQETKIQLN